MFWFGENLSDKNSWQNAAAWTSLSQKRRSLHSTPIEAIITLLDSFSKEWKTLGKEALPRLIQESGFSQEETEKTLGLLPGLLSRESLDKRIKAEFIRPAVLDKFTKLPYGSGKVRAVSNGVVLHVTAGNVFLSSIDSLIMGFLTKNLSIVKVSSQNQFFPLFFSEKLKAFDKEKILSDKFAVLHWKGGEVETETFIKSKVNTIIAWGGEEMISSYQKDLPKHVKLLDFGPKISFQLVTKLGLQDKDLDIVAEKIVADILPWDQSACASPQNLYLEEGIDEVKLLNAIEKAFLKAPARGNISDDEATEILKEKYRGLYSELMEEGKVSSGPEHLIHLEQNKLVRPSPLHRSLIVKRYQNLEELYSLLEPFSYYLQSCSYLLGSSEKNDYLEALSLSGIKRLAPLGTITYGMDGAPHDGRFVLRELVSFIGDEIRAQDYGEEVLQVENSTTLKSYFERSERPRGYVFSSGGTTGEPKYVHFSYEEFDYMSDMLAANLSRQGVRPGMTVANLFVAGNLWSSFMCVEKALEKIGAIQLPIGGMCSSENILQYLKKFRPQVVMGIPSMLVMNAEFIETQGEKIEVPMIFYAGEALSDIRKDYLSRVWKTKYFGSASYASVDAGVIGYQCSHCKSGEHHLFSDLIELNIIEEEAIVTSHARNTMPIKNYRTGDKVEWIEGECPCGSPDKRFKLLGRVDNVIQIWSCRLLTTDVEEVLSERGVLTFQLKITESREANLVREKLILTYERPQAEFEHEEFLLGLYNRSRDVKDTVSFSDFKKDIILFAVDSGAIPRNPRTGKISQVLDQRR